MESWSINSTILIPNRSIRCGAAFMLRWFQQESGSVGSRARRHGGYTALGLALSPLPHAAAHRAMNGLLAVWDVYYALGTGPTLHSVLDRFSCCAAALVPLASGQGAGALAIYRSREDRILTHRPSASDCRHFLVSLR